MWGLKFGLYNFSHMPIYSIVIYILESTPKNQYTPNSLKLELIKILIFNVSPGHDSHRNYPATAGGTGQKNIEYQ